MDKPVERLAAKASVESAVAGRTGGIMAGFLRHEGSIDDARVPIDTVSTEEAAIAAYGRVVGLARSGTAGPGAVSAQTTMSVPRTGEFQIIAPELFGFCRDKIGAKYMSAIISGTPGLSNLT